MRSMFFRVCGEGRTMKVLRALAWVLVLAPGASAYMDHGGRISRDFAKGTLTVGGGNSEELVILTWAGNGSKTEPLTVFAFCADGECGFNANGFPDDPCFQVQGAPSPQDWTCEKSSDNDHTPKASAHCKSTKGCLWAWELPGSRGNISYAPPVVSGVGSSQRVYVATANHGGGGSVWAFNLGGQALWRYDPGDPKEAKGGFYARPAVVGLAGGDRLVLAPSLKNSRMYVLHDEVDSGGYPTVSTWTAPFPIGPVGKGGGRVRFEPIPECQNNCSDPIVVYAGVESGGKKRGLYKFEVHSDSPEADIATCGRDSSVTCLDWTILDSDLSMSIGGVLVENSASKKFLVANLGNTSGTAVYAVSAREDGSCLGPDEDGNNNVVEGCFAIHSQVDDDESTTDLSSIRGTHRSHPAVRKKAGSQPEIFISQKEGGEKPGGKLWRFRLKEQGNWGHQDGSHRDRWNSVLEDAWGAAGSLGQEPWPTCLTPAKAIPTTSWSSPAIHPDGDFVFVSSRPGKKNEAPGGVYRLPVNTVDAHECPGTGDDVSANWLEIRGQVPKDGFRTTGIFTASGRRVHYGSSVDRFYTMDSKSGSECSLIACYDMDGDSADPDRPQPDGGVCQSDEVNYAAPACCSEVC